MAEMKRNVAGSDNMKKIEELRSEISMHRTAIIMKDVIARIEAEKSGKEVVYEPVSTDNIITAFWHCKECLREAGKNSYRQDIEVGSTCQGIQVWCRRHNMNITHVDLRSLMY